MKIEKNTNRDKMEILSAKVRGSTNGWTLDFDDSFVYYETWVDGEGYKSYRDAYTYTGTSAELNGSPEEVVRTTEYKVVDDLSTEKGLLSFLKKNFGGTNNEKAVIKQFQDEEMIAIEKLYIHPEDVDGVGDTISLEDTIGMVNSLNKAIESGTLQSGLFHGHKTEAFSVMKAWVAEVDCTIGETEIREGQPLIKVQFHNDKAWELRKAGTLTGISIGARATEIEELEDE